MIKYYCKKNKADLAKLLKYCLKNRSKCPYLRIYFHRKGKGKGCSRAWKL